jgi:hypothetical protein
VDVNRLKEIQGEYEAEFQRLSQKEAQLQTQLATTQQQIIATAGAKAAIICLIQEEQAATTPQVVSAAPIEPNEEANKKPTEEQ